MSPTEDAEAVSASKPHPNRPWSRGVLYAAAVAGAIGLAWFAQQWSYGQSMEIGLGISLSNLITLSLTMGFLPILLLFAARPKKLVQAVAKGAIWACAGALLARYLIPSDHGGALALIEWARYVKWPIVIVIEIQIGLLIYHSVIRKKQSMDSAVDELVQSGKIPSWIGVLAKYEAKMWKHLFGLARLLKSQPRA